MHTEAKNHKSENNNKSMIKQIGNNAPNSTSPSTAILNHFAKIVNLNKLTINLSFIFQHITLQICNGVKLL